MYILKVVSHFAAAHRLLNYKGKCESLHGHNWKVEVEVSAKNTDHEGMVIDFKELKDLIKQCLVRLDHTYLNEIPPFDKINPTSEHIANYLFHQLEKMLPSHVSMESVTVWESDTASATYKERHEK